MATCGSISLWCGLCVTVLAALSSIGMSQSNNGAQLTPSPDNCTGFSPSSPCIIPDIQQRFFCLSNGTMTGFCEAREAICGNRLQLQRDLTSCSSSTKDSSVPTTTTSQTSTSSTGKTTIGSTFNQRDRTFNQHSNTNDHHDHTNDRHNDNAAPFCHTSFNVMVLCGFAAAASRLFSLL